MEKNIRINNINYIISSDDDYLTAIGNDFEPHMVKLFKALVTPQDVVADIGANIGLTALLFSDLASKVIAFEPSPSTYEILNKNLLRAHVSNIETINFGLGEQTENLTITFARNNRSGGYISDKIRPKIGHVTEQICIDTLDRFFANSDAPPSFLKIDVEGFEMHVIKGGDKFLRKHRPTVVMEMNHFCLDVLQRITLPDFLDFMRSVFPKLYAVDVDNAIIIDLHQLERAYFVMHENVVRNRFPNIVGGFDDGLLLKLDQLSVQHSDDAPLERRLQNQVDATMAKLVEGKKFNTPPVKNPHGLLSTNTIPSSASAGKELIISVALTNKSDEIWYGYGAHPVLLSYHWRTADGAMHIHDGLRTPLTCESLSPGKSANEVVHVITPDVKGRYHLTLTLVQEGICWFEDKCFHPEQGVVDVE